MKRNEYNGWTNRQTWEVNLVLSSGYGCEIVRHCKRIADAVSDLRREYIESCGFGSDADWQSLIDAIDWRELAKHYMADVKSGY